ncbi:MAG: hypothetical protein DHS20C15_16390 [Planctomycetota bacterium]|nr:MAG: hypothetical protein DHS20C15_16390 [Planctomycetota bacterium]
MSSPGGALLRAVLLKACFVALIVWAAGAWPSESPYIKPRFERANDLVWYLSRGFDSESYQIMATEGYYDEFSRSHPPGFPLLIRAMLLLTSNRQAAGVLAANLCSLLAVLAMLALLRHYATSRDGPARHAAGHDGLRHDGVGCEPQSAGGLGRVGVSHVDLALLLGCAMPGLLAFGTVAYSESAMMLFAMLAWCAYLRAESGELPRRHLGWLLAASWLGALSLMMRDMGAPLFAAWGLIELVRVVRIPGEQRSRALLEAGALLSGGLAAAGAFAWRLAEHDFIEVQQKLWSVRFELFGGPASLMGSIDPEFVVLIYASLPLGLLLLARTWRVDKRLTLVAALGLVLMLSVTGVGAQSFNRYLWATWPLALGALAIRDRGVLWALTAWLFAVSLWCGLGHVQGSMAL